MKKKRKLLVTIVSNGYGIKNILVWHQVIEMEHKLTKVVTVSKISLVKIILRCDKQQQQQQPSPPQQQPQEQQQK